VRVWIKIFFSSAVATQAMSSKTYNANNENKPETYPSSHLLFFLLRESTTGASYLPVARIDVLLLAGCR
jgi:hypothetical protein